MTKLKKDRHTQAKKADRQNKRHKKHNLQLKADIKKKIKKLETAISSGNAEESKKLLSSLTKALHISSRKRVIHSNNASRKISKLTKKISKLK